MFRDISADKQAEVALRESEERYALAAQGANDGLWDWDLKRDQLFFSPRWKSVWLCRRVRSAIFPTSGLSVSTPTTASGSRCISRHTSGG
ncbi:MAG: hypothetical protein U0Z44_04390 [Kouleothrix sp.]